MPPKKKRPVLHAVAVLALLGASGYLTVELRKDEQAKTPATQAVIDELTLEGGTGQAERQADLGAAEEPRAHHPAR